MVWVGGLASSGTKHQMLNPEQFDTVPLISPLDVDSLCSPAPRKGMVRTRLDFQAPSRWGWLCPKGEKGGFQVSAMLMMSMVFLTCILFLVLYQLYSYDSCPSPLHFKYNRCVTLNTDSYFAIPAPPPTHNASGPDPSTNSSSLGGDFSGTSPERSVMTTTVDAANSSQSLCPFSSRHLSQAPLNY
uniref:neuronal vesicle trafficking-associated protein 2-like n=1 Tax=Myxine glutinosa TaxID=7769 RepID=UPI00358F0078